MVLLYTMFIRIYQGILLLASAWNPKARLWVRGRKNIFEKLKHDLQPYEKRAWFHCASLGEFEQGRPLIEAFKQHYPEYKIALTFFSPSGYEIQKNYIGADYVFYLPLDTKSNAEKTISLIQPKMVFFIKYEFWYHYFNRLNSEGIPIYLVSAIFRPDQLFFKWYGNFYKNLLKKVSHFFVQNESSATLLKSIGITNVTVSGDTRFDRVFTISQQKKAFPLISMFKQDQKTLIAGSTWPEDEEMITDLLFDMQKSNRSLKCIIAPHEISASKINTLTGALEEKAIKHLKYSEATEETIQEYDVLIIDNIGMLSSLYQYGEIAFIGGGFGKGIHNILEAATFGLPVLFGPNYQKFQEAVDLIHLKGAFCILNSIGLIKQTESFLTDEISLKNSAETSKNYVLSKRGATNIIMDNTRIY